MPLIGRKSVDEAILQKVAETNDKLWKAYFKTFRNIIKETPVDKGRARANWYVTQGTPSNGKSTRKSGNDVPKIPLQVLDRKIYMTNNLPYIGTLEYGGYSQPGTSKTSGGFSIQAPSGWVRVALKQLEKDIKNI